MNVGPCPTGQVLSSISNQRIQYRKVLAYTSSVSRSSIFASHPWIRDHASICKGFSILFKGSEEIKGAEVISEVTNGYSWWKYRFPQPYIQRAFQQKAAAVRVQRPSEDSPPRKGSPFTLLWSWVPFYVQWMFLATNLVPSPSWRPCHQLLGKETNN